MHKSVWQRRILLTLLSVAVLTALTGCKKDSGSSSHIADSTTAPQQVTEQSVAHTIEQISNLSESYGYKNALSELTEKNTTTLDGDTYYRLQQNYHGIPVYGQTVVCVENENGEMTALAGNAVDIDEDVDLTPTVTVEQVNTAIRTYLVDELGYDSVDVSNTGIDKLREEHLCIYNADRDADRTSHLAYCVYQGGYEFTVDAQDASVINCAQILFDISTPATGYLASDTTHDNPFPIENVDGEYYVLRDWEKGLAVYSLNGVSSGDPLDEQALADAVILQSEDEIFGNTTNENALEQESGVQLLQNISKIYDYFEMLSFIQEGVETRLYYNDSYYNGRNARGGYGQVDALGGVFGLVLMGSETGTSDIDIIAHEYTHRVSFQTVGWHSELTQTSAINEALSDIFGELIEQRYYDWGSPDWYMRGDYISVARNIAAPRKTGHKEIVSDPNNSGSSECYADSTVISHTAYLMWNGIGGDESKKISTDDLAKLWYRAMLMMPSDCDFATCRELVELSARLMNMTAQQRNCIAEAFDAAGIEQGASVLIGTQNTYLQINDINNTLYDDYTLYIAPIETTALANTPILSTVIDNSTDTRIVTTTDPQVLNLSEGSYAIAFVDNANPEKYEVWSLWISAEQTNKMISIGTKFGVLKQDETPSSNESVGADYLASMSLLTDHYWYLNIQSWEIFSFTDDGNATIYGTDMPPEASQNTDLSNVNLYPMKNIRYSFDGETLVLSGYSADGSDLVLNLYNKLTSPANITDIFTATQIEEYDGDQYFYETDWVQPDDLFLDNNATYLVRLGKKTSTDESANSYAYRQYKQILLQFPLDISETYLDADGNERNGTDIVQYVLYDIDKNGVEELIVNKNSDCYVYTVEGTELLQCGKFSASYENCLYACDGNGLVVHDGGTGSLHLEYVRLYTLSDGVLDKGEMLADTATGSYDALHDCLDSYQQLTDYHNPSDLAPLGS